MKIKTTRRDFLKYAGFSTASFALTGCGRSLLKSSNSKRPNILWISIEDISPHLGCYGEEFAITPNIDAFAQEGVRYTRAFTVHGVSWSLRSESFGDNHGYVSEQPWFGEYAVQGIETGFDKVFS